MKNKYLSSEFFSLLEAKELSLKKSLIGNFGRSEERRVGKECRL